MVQKISFFLFSDIVIKVPSDIRTHPVQHPTGIRNFYQHLFYL